MSHKSFDPPVVDRIPNEIFRRIIQYVYTTEHDKLIHYTSLLLPPVVASHVCRSWRYILLSDSSMWTYLVPSKFKLSGIEEFIRRSKSAPLKVSIKLFRYTTSVTPAIVSAIFQQIHRLKLLEVNVDTNHPRIITSRRVNFNAFEDLVKPSILELFASLQRPAPQLQTFLFNCRGTGISMSTFFDTLFSGYAPNLKEIHHKFHPDFCEIVCPLFHNLSKLTISWPGPFGVSRTHLDRLLDLLELSPCLTLLSIRSPPRYTIPPPPVSFPGRKVHLGNLKWLVLETGMLFELLNSILTYVTFPSNVKWHINTHPAQTEPELIDIDVFGPVFLLPDPKAIPQFLSKARFTSITIFIHVYLGVHLVFSGKHDPSESLTEELDSNKFIYRYSDVSQMVDHWNSSSLMESLKPSAPGITRLHIVFPHPDWSKNRLIDNVNLIQSLTSFLFKLKEFIPRLKSDLCTASCWINELDQYCDLITE